MTDQLDKVIERLAERIIRCINSDDLGPLRASVIVELEPISRVLIAAQFASEFNGATPSQHRALDELRKALADLQEQKSDEY